MKRIFLQKKQNKTILELLREQGEYLDAPCSGKGTCGKCCIIIEETRKTDPPKQREKEVFTERELEEGWRLSCMTVPTDDLYVCIPEIRENQIQVQMEFVRNTKKEKDPKRMRFIYNALRLQNPEEVKDFNPELVINCVTLSYTIEAFKAVMPYLQPYCIISDIASVKTYLKEFYETCGFPYVSTHPMFGPTFANLGQLEKENTIIISEGDHLGKIFFKDIYSSLRLHICEYTFEEHDKVVAYSLGIPFASTMVFAATMKHQDAPGTTFKRHMKIARGLLSEDDYLLTEILFNPRTPRQIERIQEELHILQEIIKDKDSEKMKEYLTKIRKNIE